MIVPKVYILIINWNGWQDTLECLTSVYRLQYDNVQVVVVDNGSNDDSVEKIVAWAKTGGPDSIPLTTVLYDLDRSRPVSDASFGATDSEGPGPSLVVIRTGVNLGFAGGNNVGLQYALPRGAHYVLLLNNDAMFRFPFALNDMVAFMEEHPQGGACGGRLFYPDGAPQSSFGNFPRLLRTLAFLYPVHRLLPDRLLNQFQRSNIVPADDVSDPVGVDYPSGACMLVRSETIADVGQLDGCYFMYVEETDWCYRMMRRGWERYYLPTVEVVHKVGASAKKSGSRRERYFLESILRYHRKHFPRCDVLILAAGLYVRSVLSLLFWKTVAMTAPSNLAERARNQHDFWLFAYSLAKSATSSAQLAE